MGDGDAPLARGAVEGIGATEGRRWLQSQAGRRLDEAGRFASHRDATEQAFATLESERIPRQVGVGHLIVHGGIRWVKPQRLDPSVLEDLRRLIPLAPLHLPNEVALILAVTDICPAGQPVASFD